MLTKVIDYMEGDFAKNGRRYDLILDLAAYHSIFDYRCALNSKEIYLMVGGSRDSEKAFSPPELANLQNLQKYGTILT